MKAIIGRFTTVHNGKPAAFGKLHLELLDQDDIENIIPLGELAESLRVPLDEEYRQEWRQEQRNRGLSDEDIAEQEAVEFKQMYRIPESYDFNLDGDGRIPPGTEIIGNDELSGDTSYRITATAQARTCSGYHPVCFQEDLKIMGDLPVDLNRLAVPCELKFDPDAHLSPRERDLKAVDAAIVRDGTAKFGKKNRMGFFAGTIHCPTNAGSVSLPSRERNSFSVFAFSLPFSAVVNRVSILVDTASNGFVLVGVYDGSGRKRCEVAIDLSRVGPATGIFPSAVNP